MKYRAEIDVMPHDELLDPQGKALTKNMHNLDISGISMIRVGKHLRVELEANDKEEATLKIEQACQNLFINPIMERYSYSLHLIDKS